MSMLAEGFVMWTLECTRGYSMSDLRDSMFAALGVIMSDLRVFILQQFGNVDFDKLRLSVSFYVL